MQMNTKKFGMNKPYAIPMSQPTKIDKDKYDILLIKKCYRE